MNSTIKTLIFWVVIVISSALLWQVVRSGNRTRTPEISYSSFLSDVASGKVAKVKIEGTRLYGDYKSGETFSVVIPSNPTATVQTLQQNGVEIWFHDVSGGGWPSWILNLAPLVLLGALWFFMIRQMQRSRRSTWPPQPPSGSDLSQPPHFGP